MRKISVCVLIFFMSSCRSSADLLSVEDTMDAVVSRLYDKHSSAQLDTLSHAYILKFLTKEEKQALAENYWKFEVNVPVKVSIMRHKKQEVLPFWIENSGFLKTELTVSSEMYEYEVWQKDFSEGLVQLGINGFDKHRPVYFVSVSPLNLNDKLEVKPVYPDRQHIEKMDVGAFTYHDWDGLKLSHVPDELRGQQLLTTIRGRAREAHLINSFRKTDFPSSDVPDQVLLTWNDDPQTSVAISWRTSVLVSSGEILYWESNTTDTLTQVASVQQLHDRLLSNDRYIHRFTANLSRLKPGTSYTYKVKGDATVYTFKTASPATQFSFTWFGDTHNDQKWGDMLQGAHFDHPETEFYMIAGDLVNTGLHRDDWDKFFKYSGRAFSEKPMMAIPGNHDSQDGLGARLYQDLLPYPKNGPDGLAEGLTYSFRYKNAHYLMIDGASFSNDDQTEWIEEQLRNSEATWKFLFVHFPPYNEVEDYPELVEKWVPIFDKYHLDFVIGGHFHYYLRTFSLKGGKADPSGTIYMTSVGTSAAREAKEHKWFVEKRFEKGNFYQVVDIKGSKLEMKVYDNSGSMIDSFRVEKEE